MRFYKGLFEETLPTYDWPEYDCLVVNMDADLYTSTVCALSFIRDHLRPGSYLYFDEFNHRADELRAFDEFLDETMHFRVVCATRELSGVAFQCVG